MGQKVNPNGFRYGITKKHNAVWFDVKNGYVDKVVEDEKIQFYIDKFVRHYAIGKVVIERTPANDVIVRIHSAKPGFLLGKDGANIKQFTKDIRKATKNHKLKLRVDVVVIEKAELNARLVAEEIALKLENRGSFRIAQKFAIRFAMKNGAKGIKTQVAGRLNGADMARTEGYTEGEMKLHTLRQDVDYAMARAKTTYGIIGVKVWVSLGEVKTTTTNNNTGGRNATT